MYRGAMENVIVSANSTGSTPLKNAHSGCPPGCQLESPTLTVSLDFTTHSVLKEIYYSDLAG
jgi:hypothetical protein